MKVWEAVVAECKDLLATSDSHRRARIICNLKLGEIVDDVVKNTRYGDNAVVKLASSLTEKMGKMIYPQRLYEAMSVFRTIKTIEKVDEIEKEVKHEITWEWLKKNSTRKAENCEGAERKLKMEKKLKKVESALSELDSIDASKLRTEEKEELTGLAICTIQTAESLLKKVSGSNESENKPNTPRELITDEVMVENKVLKHVIGYNELTGEIPRDKSALEIHCVGTGRGIENSIVVTRLTHEKIHGGAISQEIVIDKIHERNARYAMMYFDILLDEPEKMAVVKS